MGESCRGIRGQGHAFDGKLYFKGCKPSCTAYVVFQS